MTHDRHGQPDVESRPWTLLGVALTVAWRSLTQRYRCVSIKRRVAWCPGDWGCSHFKKESQMFNLKHTVLFAAAVATLTFAPVAPASAVIPWFFAHHVVEALVGLAAVSSSAAGAPAPYSPPPAYGASAYYAPPAYYARPSTYYSPATAYYPGPGYYRPGVSYARPLQHFYGAARGYSAPSSRYTGLYGAHSP